MRGRLRGAGLGFVVFCRVRASSEQATHRVKAKTLVKFQRRPGNTPGSLETPLLLHEKSTAVDFDLRPALRRLLPRAVGFEHLWRPLTYSSRAQSMPTLAGTRRIILSSNRSSGNCAAVGNRDMDMAVDRFSVSTFVPLSPPGFEGSARCAGQAASSRSTP